MAQAGSASSAWRSAASAPGWTTRSGLETSTHSGGGLPRQGGQAAVDPGPVAEVAAGPHDAHRRDRSSGEHVGQGGGRAAGRAVLHHDDWRRPVGEQRADAAGEHWPGIVVDHDGADRAGHPVLSTPG